MRKYAVLPIKLALEAVNEHLAAEVCRVTVHTSRFDCYLQELRTGHFENEQTAAEGRRVTVHICSFLVYLRCVFTSHFNPCFWTVPVQNDQSAREVCTGAGTSISGLFKILNVFCTLFLQLFLRGLCAE